MRWGVDFVCGQRSWGVNPSEPIGAFPMIHGVCFASEVIQDIIFKVGVWTLFFIIIKIDPLPYIYQFRGVDREVTIKKESFGEV